MEKDAFLALLKSPPEEYSIDQLNQLEALLGQHPYFQTAWALHLKALKPFDEVAYDRVLKRTAAHTSDREVLFEFITAEDFSPNHLAAGHPAHRKNRKEDSEGLVAMESADLEFAPAEEEEKTATTSEDLVEEPDWDAYASTPTEAEEEIVEEVTEATSDLQEETESIAEEASPTEEISEEVEEELNEVEASEEAEETTQESEEEWTPLTEAEMRSLGLLDDHTLVSEEAEIEEAEIEESEEEEPSAETELQEELEDIEEGPSSEMSEEAEPESLEIEEEALLEESTEEVSDEMLEELALSESLEEVDETEPLSEEDEVVDTSLSTPAEEHTEEEELEPLQTLESTEEPIEEEATEAEAEVEPTEASPWYDQALTEEDQPSFALSGDSEPLADLEPITEEETEMDLIADATLSLANEDSDLNRNPMFQTDFELDEEEKEPAGPPAEKRSFSDWLHKTKSKEENTPPAPNPISDSERGRKFEMLDRFLESNPKIIPVVSEEITVDIEESVQVNRSEIMTETLAQLYREQKKYKKALKGYEVLRLKYPEKSSFFAAQIQELKALIKEKKNKQ